MAHSSRDVDGTCLSILSTPQAVGVSFIAQSGMISTVAVLIFAGLVVRNVIQNRLRPGPNGPKPLIRTHVDAYMISLMFADLLQGLGAIMSAKWASEGRVYCSNYCTAQGAIQQLGETGVAMSTLAITVHTFVAVFFRWQPNRIWWLWIVVVGLIWTYLLSFVLAGFLIHFHHERNGGQPFYGPTPYWCWIKESFVVEQIMGEYFWLWFCAAVNIFLYIPLFFALRGNIEVDPENWKRIRFHRLGSEDSVVHKDDSSLSQEPKVARPKPESREIRKAKNAEAMKMFWYPLSYTLLVLPLSVNRWSTNFNRDQTYPIAGKSITKTAIVLFIFGLSGLINVILFMLTRPNLLLFSEHREASLRKREGNGANNGSQSDASLPLGGGTGASGYEGRLADSDDEMDDRAFDFDASLQHEARPVHAIPPNGARALPETRNSSLV